MSWQAVAWVLDHSAARGANLNVLVAIAERSNELGENAWPSAADIARRTRMPIRSVRRCLRDLRDWGSIEQTGVTSSGAPIYRVPFVEQVCPLTQGHPPDAGSPLRDEVTVEEDTRTGGPDTRTDAADLTSPEPSLEPSPQPSTEPEGEKRRPAIWDQVRSAITEAQLVALAEEKDELKVEGQLRELAQGEGIGSRLARARLDAMGVAA